MAHEGKVGAGPTRGKKKNMGEIEAPKEWRRPALRRLPISATANVGEFYEGGGKGKGKSGAQVSS